MKTLQTVYRKIVNKEGGKSGSSPVRLSGRNQHIKERMSFLDCGQPTRKPTTTDIRLSTSDVSITT